MSAEETYHPIQIVSLGPGDPGLLNRRTTDALEQAETLILRTARHPVADDLRQRGIAFETLDELYETAEDFDELRRRVVELLTEKAREQALVYAVPDAMTDGTVEALFRSLGKSGCLSIIPGVGYTDAALAAGLPMLTGRDEAQSAEGLRTVSASAFSGKDYNPDLPLLITEADNAALIGDLKIALGDLLPDEAEIGYLPDLSAPVLQRIPLYAIDRQPAYSHLTAFLIPGFGLMERSRHTLRDLETVMARLRGPEGCPWDKTQTHLSLRPWLVEEAWEAVGAIDEGDPDHLADELGDVLFQVVFHASIGADFDEFTLRDVITDICRKMIRRHPHVFGDRHFDTAQEVAGVWEQLKRDEQGGKTVGESLGEISPGLPSLKYAAKAHKKMRQWPGLCRTAAALTEELRSGTGSLLAGRNTLNEEAMGKLLMTCAELCQICGVDAELALRRAADQRIQAFRNTEKQILLDGKAPESLTNQELRVYFSHVEERTE